MAVVTPSLTDTLATLRSYWSRSGTSLFAIGTRFATAGFSFISALAVVTMFDPARVGIFLSFISLAGLSTLLDLGISYSGLLATATRPEGDSDAMTISSIIVTTPTVIFTGLGLYFGGRYFLRHGAGEANWPTPWLAYCILASVQQLLMLLVTHAEGSGRRHAAWRANFTFEVVAGLLTVFFVLCKIELWAFSVACLARIILIFVLFPGQFSLISRARRLSFLQINEWRNELWPMQWRMLVNTASGLFTTRLLTPILLTVEGAREAGRIGLILALGTVISSATIAWPLSQTAIFANLLHGNIIERFLILFRRTTLLSTALAILLAVLAVAGLILLRLISTKFSDHLPSLSIMCKIMATVPLTHISGAFAIALRSRRRDPVVVLNCILAIPSIIALYLAARIGPGMFASVYLGASFMFTLVYCGFFLRFYKDLQIS